MPLPHGHARKHEIGSVSSGTVVYVQFLGSRFDCVMSDDEVLGAGGCFVVSFFEM